VSTDIKQSEALDFTVSLLIRYSSVLLLLVKEMFPEFTNLARQVQQIKSLSVQFGPRMALLDLILISLTQADDNFRERTAHSVEYALYCVKLHGKLFCCERFKSHSLRRGPAKDAVFNPDFQILCIDEL
jgi:hypothetical protein